MKTFARLLMISFLTSLFAVCSGAKPEKFASDAPVKKIVFDAPFPNDLIYQSAPDAKVVVGTKRIKPAIYEIGGFEVETGKRLWQLPFVGEIVGQTETRILVYEEKTATVYFINPKSGEITRKIAPAPNPLTSKNALELGMAFTDDVYLTTKALYTSIWQQIGDENAPPGDANDAGNYREDDSFKTGITAKRWQDEETKWFLPPVKQILKIENRPVIFGDKVLIINPNYSPHEQHFYQIVSLKTGAETFRGESVGYFHYLDNKFFIEQTESFTRRIEPLTGKELWRVEHAAKFAFVSAVGNQITVSTNNGTNRRTIEVIDAETGKLLKQFELLNVRETVFKAAFVTKANQVLLNFDSEVFQSLEKELYNYWVGYDADAKKALWRTDFNAQSASSLFPFASDKMRIE